MNPQISFLAAVILFGFIQGLLLMYFFIKRKPVGGIYLLLITTTLTIMSAESFLNISGFMIYTLPILNISIPFVFLLGPFLFLYTSSHISKTAPSRFQLSHYLPFCIYFFYSFFFFLQPSAFKYNAYATSFDSNLALLETTLSFSPDPINLQGLVVVELLSIHILLYALGGFYLLYRNRSFNLLEKKNAVLMYANLFLLISGVLLVLAEGGVINGKVIFQSLLPNNVPKVYLTAIIYMCTAYVIKDPHFFASNGKKYLKSSLSQDLRRSKLGKLDTFLREEKPFLNNTFSLKELSEKTAISTNHISQVINEELGVTFYELTNRYRIEESKKHLSNPTFELSMEKLAYKLGYKSKSAFYNAFKKETSLTPSQYKNEHRTA